MTPLIPSPVSVASKQPQPLVRSLLTTFSVTAVAVFTFSLLVYQSNKWFCEQVVCRPGRHYLLEPVINGGPAAWLIAGVAVGVVVVLVNLTYRGWRRAR